VDSNSGTPSKSAFAFIFEAPTSSHRFIALGLWNWRLPPGLMSSGRTNRTTRHCSPGGTQGPEARGAGHQSRRSRRAWAGRMSRHQMR
jgi:hypothetical protein